MRATEFLNEDNQPGSSTGDYQQMLAFIRANRVEGVPQDQQVALALFKELQKQKRQSQELSNELSAAEQRINLATQRGDSYEKELNKHQSELDREQQAIAKQQATLGQIDQQYAERAQASQQQIETLTDKLQSIKNKPGVDDEAARALEKQIQELGKNGVPMDRFRELEQSISMVQQSNRVDHGMIQDLVAQVNDAQATAQSLEKTKDTMTQDLTKSSKDAMDRVERLTQEIEDLKRLAGTVKQSNLVITDVIAPTLNQLKSKVGELDSENEFTHKELLKHDSFISKLAKKIPGI